MAAYRVWDKDKSEANKKARDALEAAYPEDDEEEGKDAWDLSQDHIVVLRREGDAMVLVSESKSPFLIEQERLAGEARCAELLKLKGWRESSPLWLKLLELCPRARASWLYASYNDREAGCANPVFFRVGINPDIHSDYQSTISWGLNEGEITVERWIRGKGNTKPTFPRTEAGIEAAYLSAQEHINKEAK